MIFLLYGDDDFSSGKKLREMIEKFNKNNPGATSVVFDFFDNDFKLSEIESAIRSEGLFSEKKAIVLKNMISETDAFAQKEMVSVLKKKKNRPNEDDNLLLIFWEKMKPKKNNQLFKFLSENFELKEFPKMNGNQIKKWIELKISGRGLRIDRDALSDLVLFCSEDMWTLNNEIEKLCNCKEHGNIEKKDVEVVVGEKTVANIFDTIEALLSGNKKRALELLHNQLNIGDDPFYILSMYIYQCRNLLKIADLYFKGVGNNYEIAKLTKMHPFVAQKGINQVRNLSLAKLKKIYQELAKIDEMAKTGKANIVMSLDKFIIAQN